jgi:hypothetical protein
MISWTTLTKNSTKKLDPLTKLIQTTHNTTWKTHAFHSRVINLSSVKFTGEQIRTLALGPSHAIEKDPQHYVSELIIDTENSIRQLDPKMQNTFRYLATKKIKQIMTTTTHNSLHKKRGHTPHSTQDTHYGLKNILPLHNNFNDVFLLIISTKTVTLARFLHLLPDDGPNGLKHVGAI